MFCIDKQSSVECCFGLEAVNWITDNIDTVSRSEAVKLLEVCYKARYTHIPIYVEVFCLVPCYTLMMSNML